MKKAGSCICLLLLAFTLSAEDSFPVKKKPRIYYCGWTGAGVNLIFARRTVSNLQIPTPSFIVRIFNGVRFSRVLSAGIETGVDGGGQVPINALLRINLLRGRLTPFVDVSAGYSYCWMEYAGHGFNASPAVGLKVWGAKAKAAFTLRAGYVAIYARFIKGEKIFNANEISVDDRGFYQSVTMMAGVEF